MLNYLSQWALLSWISFVVYKYFQYHPEYSKAYNASPKIFITFFITFLVIYWCFFLYESYFNDKDIIKVKKSPFSFILIWLFWVLLISTILFSKTWVWKAWISYFSIIWSVFWKLFPVIITLWATLILSFLFWDTISKLLKIKWLEIKKWIVSIVLGLSSIMLILFFLWWAQLLTKPFVLWVAVILFLLSYKSYWDFVDWLFAKNKEKEEIQFFSISTFLYIVLFFFIAINCFDVMRPMPIGWDDMWVYLNMPQRIAEDWAILSGQWWQAYMLLSSIGFILWPDYVWDMVWMYFSWFWWLLAIFAVFVFAKRFFNEKIALFAATYYYLMPMITFQSALDMKMDPPLFLFMVTWAIVLFDKSHWLLWKIADLMHKVTFEDKIKWWVWWFILSTAFFIKITTAMEAFAFIALISFFIFNWKTTVWIILIECSVFLLWFARIPEFTPEIIKVLVSLFALWWVVILSISKIKKFQLIHLLNIVFPVIIWFLVVAIPWWVFNYSDSKKLSFNWITSWRFAESPKIDLEKVWIDIKWNDEEYCGSTARKEELWRYIWYNQPFIQKYFTLPWKNTMNTETRWYYLDIWFLYLAIIPWLFLLWLWRKWWKKEWWIVILFSVNWFLWAFVAFGVPWYWLFWFLPAIVLVWMFLYNEDLNKTYFKYISVWLILTSFVSFAFLRETKTWNWATIKYAFWLQTAEQTVDSIVPTYRDTSKMIAWDISQEEYTKLIEKYMLPFYEEQIKKQEPDIADEKFNAVIAQYKQSISSFKIPKRTKDNPAYVYHIGTFIPYFIKDSRRVMSWDFQLDRFRCIDWDWTDDKRTLDRLKKLWFHYVIFDTNTATIEKDPNWTLHQKVKRFIDFANKNLKVIYYKPANGIAFMML